MKSFCCLVVERSIVNKGISTRQSNVGKTIKHKEDRLERMALTRAFKETVAKRVAEDPAFARALLDEAIHLFIDGEPEIAKSILRDLINATIGFEALALEIDRPAKSLHRMLSETGNPTMTNISTIFAAVKKELRVEIRTEVVPV